ncbi:hypothetical protein V5799_017396 [Amblyomma americanum]|uniref:Uncharacterized protein n=1 Tax=Amblyomma americanum TaxID=6943 RepID=A0AAQ4F3E6_AMBAM
MAERLSLLAEYVTSRFTSAACLRRYLHKHFRGGQRVDDDEVSALAALLALGLRVDVSARRPVAAVRAHKYWHDAPARSPTSPVENAVESSLDNTTTCTWEASSAELHYRRVSPDEEDSEDEEDEGAEPLRQHSDAASADAAMVLLPHGPPAPRSAPQQRLAGDRPPGSLAARTRRWLAVLMGRQLPPAPLD